MRSEEQIYDHTDISTHSIEMPFKSTPSIHLNQLKEFEEEKQVEEVVHACEAVIFLMNLGVLMICSERMLIHIYIYLVWSMLNLCVKMKM